MEYSVTVAVYCVSSTTVWHLPLTSSQTAPATTTEVYDQRQLKPRALQYVVLSLMGKKINLKKLNINLTLQSYIAIHSVYIAMLLSYSVRVLSLTADGRQTALRVI